MSDFFEVENFGFKRQKKSPIDQNSVAWSPSAGPLAQREERFGNRRVGKLACQGVWVRSPSSGTGRKPA
jgi:hypothetical protein